MGERRGFGRLRKRDSGRWQAGYVGPDGNLHNAPTTFTAKIDAEGWLAAERRLIEQDDWLPPKERSAQQRTRGITFGQYAESWVERRKLKPSTMALYRKLLDNRLLPDLGDLELKRITRDQVAAWHEYQGPATPTTTAHAYALLRTIFNSAIDDGLVKVNPCQVKSAGRTKRVKRIEPASLKELEVISATMAPRYRLAILLAAWCALRFGEITELRRNDIDLKNGRIHVRRGVTTVDGQRVVGTPKTEAGIRTVAIPPHLVEFINAHLETHAQPGRNGLLFHGKDGGQLAGATLHGKPARRRMINGRMVNESATGFYKAKEAAGRPDLRFHDLRHTGAVLAAQAGATLAELMSRLGHTTPAAAMIYQHAAADRDTEIAKRLSEMVGGTETP